MNLSRLTLICIAPLAGTNAHAISVSYDYGVASSMAKVSAPEDSTEYVESGTVGGDGLTPFAYMSASSKALSATASAFAQVYATGENELAALGPFNFASQSIVSGVCGAGCAGSQMSAPSQHLTEFHTDVGYNFSANYTWLAQSEGAVTSPGPNFLVEFYNVETMATYIFLSASTSVSGAYSGYVPPGDYFLKAATTNFLFVYDGTSAARSTAATFDLTLTPAPVPLPAAGWLLLSGLAGLGALARRRRIVTTR